MLAVFRNSSSKTMPSKEPDGSSRTILTMFLSTFRALTNPHTYKSESFFMFFKSVTSLSSFDSGLSEMICLSLLKRLRNKAPYPLTPSPDVILFVGSDNILTSDCIDKSSLIPRCVSKSSWLIWNCFCFVFSLTTSFMIFSSFFTSKPSKILKASG